MVLKETELDRSKKMFSYNGLMKIILRNFGMKLTNKMMLSLCFGFLAIASCAEEGPAWSLGTGLSTMGANVEA